MDWPENKTKCLISLFLLLQTKHSLIPCLQPSNFSHLQWNHYGAWNNFIQLNITLFLCLGAQRIKCTLQREVFKNLLDQMNFIITHNSSTNQVSFKTLFVHQFIIWSLSGVNRHFLPPLQTVPSTPALEQQQPFIPQSVDRRLNFSC